MTREALLAACLDFDGKRKDPLEAFAVRNEATPELIDALCDLALSDAAPVTIAATWLLRRFRQEGAALSAEQSDLLLKLLLVEIPWQARLHLLQMLDGLSITAAQAEALWRRLMADTREGNKFIRAWSLHALAVIGDGHAAYRDEALAALAMAEGDDAGSVRARVRQSRKRFAWA